MAKRIYSKRNTGMFYALIAQLPGYESRYKDLIKEGVVDDFLTDRYGKFHNRPLSLSKLSDAEYREMIEGLRRQIEESKSSEQLQDEALRKFFGRRIFAAFSKIGVFAVGDDYSEVNRHIKKLPISKGRIMPAFKTDELESLCGAVYAYCDNIKKKQIKEQHLASNN